MITASLKTFYNVNFELCALLFILVAAIYFYSTKRPKTMKNRVFSVLIVAGILAVSLDVVTAFTIYSAASVPLWLNNTLLVLLFTFQNAMSAILVYYVLCLARVPFGKSLVWILVMLIPFAICEGMLLVTPFNHLMFYFDANFVYVHTKWFRWIFGINFFYLAVSACAALLLRRRLSIGQTLTVVGFSVLCLLAVALQYLFPNYSLIGCAIGLSINMFYLSLQNPRGHLDELTGVFNRTCYQGMLEEIISTRSCAYVSVVALDDMKVINNTYSLDTGSQLIAEFAKYLDSLGTGEVFRLVGDQFTIVSRSFLDSERLSQKVAARVKMPFVIEDVSIMAAACVCYGARIDRNSDLSDFMLANERAMTNAKKQGRNTVVCVSDGVIQSTRRELTIENALHEAVHNDSIEVWYQPIYNVAQERFTAVEALARFRHPELGSISPSTFIPMAEKNGLIVPMDSQILHKVCRFLTANHLCGQAPGKLEFTDVNLSAVELAEEQLPVQLIQVLERFGLKEQIHFEVTETAATLSFEQAEETLVQLAENGLHISLDDFGSGYANFDSVISLPFKTVKIDRKVMEAGMKNEQSRITLEYTFQMLKALNMTIVTEGVETPEQDRWVRSIGTDYIQGFYYARPMPEQEFLQFMKHPVHSAKESRKNA